MRGTGSSRARPRFLFLFIFFSRSLYSEGGFASFNDSQAIATGNSSLRSAPFRCSLVEKCSLPGFCAFPSASLSQMYLNPIWERIFVPHFDKNDVASHVCLFLSKGSGIQSVLLSDQCIAAFRDKITQTRKTKVFFLGQKAANPPICFPYFLFGLVQNHAFLLSAAQITHCSCGA